MRTGRARRAQRWFADEERRKISTTFDDRETEPSRVLNAAIALALAPEARRVLDVGCGGGEMLGSIRRLDATLHLVGIDPVESAVAEARRRFGADAPATFAVAAAEDLEDLEHPVDLAVSHLNLGLWSDPLRGLTRVMSHLAPGGVLFVVDVAEARTSADTEAFLALARTDDEREYLSDQLAAGFEPRQLEDLLHAAADEARRKVDVHVGRGGLAGFAYDDARAGELFAASAVREALQAFSSGDSTANAVVSAVVNVR